MQSNLSHATTWCNCWVSALASAATQLPTPYSSGRWSAALTLAIHPQICRQTLQQVATPAELARFSLWINKASIQKADVGGVGLNKAAEPETPCRLVAGWTSITMSHRRRWSGTWGLVVCLLSFQKLSFPRHRISTANLSGYYCVSRLHCAQAQYFFWG